MTRRASSGWLLVASAAGMLAGVGATGFDRAPRRPEPAAVGPVSSRIGRLPSSPKRVLARQPSALSCRESIRAIVRRWRSETDPGRRARIERELDALVNGENAAFILGSLPPEMRHVRAALTALERWSEQEPAAALAWIAAAPAPSDQEIGLTVRALLGQKPDQLRAYLGRLSDGEWKQNVLSAAAAAAVASDLPVDAASWLMQLDPPLRPPETMERAAKEWARQDVVAAAQWAGDQPDPSLQESMLANVAVGYAQQNPGGAIAFAESALNPGKALNSAISGIVNEWADKNLWAAAEGLQHLPAGEVRNQAVKSLLDYWADFNPAGAIHASQ